MRELFFAEFVYNSGRRSAPGAGAAQALRNVTRPVPTRREAARTPGLHSSAPIPRRTARTLAA